jgi:streptomycin 6-kinase
MHDSRKIWLDSLPSLIEKISLQWNLHDLKPLPKGFAGNVVFMGEQKGTNPLGGERVRPIVLKLGYNSAAMHREVEALDFYRDNGCVQLFDVDEECKALLLERIIPGTPLKSLFPQHDELALTIAAQVMQKLHAVPLSTTTHQFPPIAEWLHALHTDWPSLQHHLPKARTLAAKLLHTQGKQVLLHGDLHHENILLGNNNEWIAIDPKGVVGEALYEVGASIRSPMPELPEQLIIREIITHRLDFFADLLKTDRQRLKEWTYVQEVLGDCWSLEEGVHPDDLTDLASLIDAA